MKIGNICYVDELVNHTKVDYINYIDYKNGGNKLSEIDPDLPTLTVGWESFKSRFPYFHSDGRMITVSILEKEYIKNNRFWEFSFNEKKSEHISGVNMFVRNVPYYYFRSNYSYNNVDPLFFNIYDIKDLKSHLPTQSQGVYNFKNEMLYVLNNDTIYGVDLRMHDFYHVDDPNKIIDLVKETTDKYIDDSEGSIYLETYKTYPNFEELKRYLVVLLSKP